MAGLCAGLYLLAPPAVSSTASLALMSLICAAMSAWSSTINDHGLVVHIGCDAGYSSVLFSDGHDREACWSEEGSD